MVEVFGFVLALVAGVVAAVLWWKLVDARAEIEALQTHRIKMCELLDEAIEQLDEHRKYEQEVVAEAKMMRWRARPALGVYGVQFQIDFTPLSAAVNRTVYRRIIHDALMNVEEEIMLKQENGELRMF